MCRFPGSRAILAEMVNFDHKKDFYLRSPFALSMIFSI